MHYAVCDFLLDLVQNSIEAGAKVVTVSVIEDGAAIRASVVDDGKGIDEAELARAKDPFYTDGRKHARRKVGLGIPFLLQALELAGGDYSLSSVKGEGTVFDFWFPTDGIDTPPLGDIAGFFLSAMCFDGDYQLKAEHRATRRGVDYQVSRSDIIEAVGDLTDAGALVLAREYLVSQETA